MPKKRARLRTFLAWFVAAITLIVLVVFGLAKGGGGDGRPAPALPTARLSGPAVTLSSLHGHPAVVTFWASWCPPCEREAPVIKRFSESLGDRAKLVGVNWEDPSIAEARSFLRRYGWSFSNLRDPEGNSGRAYGVTALPMTVAIDSSGRVRATLHGPQTSKTLAAALASASG
jgi:cytochrome c biogenesis protein CcmG, thiol:disulfide interchange protein DsbE